MRRDLRRFRSAILLILAFSLGLGAQLLQAQVSVTPGRYRFGATIAPSANDGAALGTASLSWSDLFLASGAVINAGNGEVTVTFAANSATLAGGQLLLPDGTGALPSLAGTNYATTGLYWAAGPKLVITGSESQRWEFDFSSNVGTFLPVNDDFVGIGAATKRVAEVYTTLLQIAGSTSVRVQLGNEGAVAGVIQQGVDAATPVTQTYKGADARAGTDTDTGGGDIIFAAGRGTGTGNPGNIYFQTGATNTPGTGAGPLTTRLQIASSGVTIIASHTRFNVASSTTGTNTPVFSGNAPIGQTAPYVWVAAIASDGTAVWIPAWR